MILDDDVTVIWHSAMTVASDHAAVHYVRTTSTFASGHFPALQVTTHSPQSLAP